MFNIVGDRLYLIDETLDPELKFTFSIRVRVTDLTDLYLEKEFLFNCLPPVIYHTAVNIYPEGQTGVEVGRYLIDISAKLHYQWTKALVYEANDNDYFDISTEGVVTLNKAVDLDGQVEFKVRFRMQAVNDPDIFIERDRFLIAYSSKFNGCKYLGMQQYHKAVHGINLKFRCILKKLSPFSRRILEENLEKSDKVLQGNISSSTETNSKIVKSITDDSGNLIDFMIKGIENTPTKVMSEVFVQLYGLSDNYAGGLNVQLNNFAVGDGSTEGTRFFTDPSHPHSIKNQNFV